MAGNKEQGRISKGRKVSKDRISMGRISEKQMNHFFQISHFFQIRLYDQRARDND